MRRDVLWLVLVLLAVAAVSAWQYKASRAAELERVRTSIQANIDIEDSAFAGGDADGFLRFCSPQYSQTDVDGTVYSLQVTRRDLQSMFKSTSGRNIRSRVLSVEMDGATVANIVVSEHVKYIYSGQPRDEIYMLREIWALQYSEWRRQKGQILSREPVTR